MFQGERKQDSSQEQILHKKGQELSGNSQAVTPKEQENVDKTLTETKIKGRVTITTHYAENGANKAR